MKRSAYPLAQVIEVKQRRAEEAEKVVREKKEILDKEKEKLALREKERDQVKRHQVDKLTQLRDTLDQGTTSPTIQQMKAYLKIVDEKLKGEEKRVKEQQNQVAIAEKKLEEAKTDWHRKRQEVDKLLEHKKDWEREKGRELRVIEEREQDELGTVIHEIRHRRSSTRES